MESLYVCLFSNGHIKVGRTGDLPTRIKAHSSRVACMGAVLTDVTNWVCEDEPESRERWLIDLCADRCTDRHQSEWFVGLEFNTVRSWAAQAAKLPIPLDYLIAEAPEPVDVHSDWALIQAIGPAVLARELNTAIQRVQNWKYRGIPPRVRLDRPDLFTPKPAAKREKARA